MEFQQETDTLTKRKWCISKFYHQNLPAMNKTGQNSGVKKNIELKTYVKSDSVKSCLPVNSWLKKFLDWKNASILKQPKINDWILIKFLILI